jgi:hypothetical protein
MHFNAHFEENFNVVVTRSACSAYLVLEKNKIHQPQVVGVWSLHIVCVE